MCGMSATIPGSLRAGDTLSATWSDPDHPATAGWVQQRLDLRIQQVLIDEVSATW